jgi:hypothetical protein
MDRGVDHSFDEGAKCTNEVFFASKGSKGFDPYVKRAREARRWPAAQQLLSYLKRTDMLSARALRYVGLGMKDHDKWLLGPADNSRDDVSTRRSLLPGGEGDSRGNGRLYSELDGG